MSAVGLVGDGVVGTRGGATGTAVVMDDLDTLAGVLQGLADEVLAAAAAVQIVASDVDLAASAVLSPVTAARAVAEITRAGAGPWGAAGCGAGLAGIAVHLRASAAAYRATETAQAAAWRTLDVAGGIVLGLAGPALALGAAGAAATAQRAGGDPAALAQGVLLDHPELTGHVVNGLPGVLSARLPGGPLTVSALAAAGVLLPTSALAASRLFDAGRYVVRADGPVVDVVPPGSLADLAGLLDPDPPPPPGSVDLVETTTPDPEGAPRTAYLLVVGGTYDWSPPGNQADASRDLGSNLQLMGGDLAEATQALLAVVEAAGVPQGAPVAIVGHSQGGMIAMQAAGWPPLRDRVRVTDVVTFGSPVALMAPPRDVHVLSVENRPDLVPRLDGAENPDRAEHLSVTVDAAATSIGGAHAMSAYRRGAAAADDAAAPGPQRHLGVAAALAALRGRGILAWSPFDRARSTARRRRYQVTARRGAPVAGEAPERRPRERPSAGSFRRGRPTGERRVSS